MKLFYRLRVRYKLWLRKHRLVESFCKECGRNVHDFTAPDDVWGKIAPLIKRGNVLCYDCFCEACSKAGLFYGGSWRLTPVDCLHSDCGLDELHCERCHADYEVWFAPGELWKRVGVALDGDSVQRHFLCTTCFTTLAAEAGINDRWLVTNDTAAADMLAELRHRQSWSHPFFGYE